MSLILDIRCEPPQSCNKTLWLVVKLPVTIIIFNQRQYGFLYYDNHHHLSVLQVENRAVSSLPPGCSLA